MNWVRGFCCQVADPRVASCTHGELETTFRLDRWP
jgi:hypothetical protein